MQHGTNLHEALKQSETVLKHKLDKMKTTENISLAGYAFTIESDAYSELDAYLTDIHEAFATDASAEEITADIEARIAELLKEKYIPGMAVSLEMVNEIKKRIGDPKMLAADEPEVSETPSDDKEARKQHNSLKNRHLYRNLEEKVLGGVCAGLGSYFGIDRVLFRILFLLFFFIGFLGIDDGPYFGFSLLAYICLWIAMPAARTAEQKREMKGKPTNLGKEQLIGLDAAWDELARGIETIRNGSKA